MSNSFRVEGLDVRFGTVRALRNVSIEFSPGVNGIVGPNGAGKSTLFRVITGGLKPTAGALFFDNLPIDNRRAMAAHQRRIGYLPQDPDWFQGFSAFELCCYIAGLRCVPKAKRKESSLQALSAVGLSDRRDVKLSALSGGQRRRVFIAQALVHNPEILILDEPTSGLDPVQRILLRELIEKLGEDHMVLLSTHLVEDVAHISNFIVAFNLGEIIWSGSAAELGAIGDSDSASQISASAFERGFLSLLGVRST